MTDDSQREALKPCPFCGGPGHLQHSNFELHSGFHVVCYGRKDCPLYCSEPYRAFDTENEAITAWNARTPPAQDAAAVDEARVEAIARNRYNRCFDDHPWEKIDEPTRESWRDGARKDLAADPATAQLAEARGMLDIAAAECIGERKWRKSLQAEVAELTALNREMADALGKCAAILRTDGRWDVSHNDIDNLLQRART